MDPRGDEGRRRVRAAAPDGSTPSSTPLAHPAGEKTCRCCARAANGRLRVSGPSRTARRSLPGLLRSTVGAPRTSYLRYFLTGTGVTGYSSEAVLAAHPDWFTADVTSLIRLLAEGKITPRIHRAYPLAGAAEAHRELGRGQVTGKIVLTPPDRSGNSAIWPTSTGISPSSFLLDLDHLTSYGQGMSPLPAPAPWTQPLPEAAPPSGMAIYQLPTGTYETRAALAVRGGSWRDKRHFAATAVLVQHPEGDFLIDAGFGADVAAHVASLRRFARAPYQATKTARAQLDASGYDRGRLLGVLLTHSHWDHVSGLSDLRVPIWTNAGELEYAAEDSDGVFRTVSAGHEIHEYKLDGPSYLGFPSSYDVYGDGSVVLALAAGHTTGSVVVFVAVPSGQRYAFIGDVTWQCDGVQRRVLRPWLMSKLADSDPGQLREDLLRVIALKDLMQVIPAHDVGAFDGIPRLPARLTPAPAPESAEQQN